MQKTISKIVTSVDPVARERELAGQLFASLPDPTFKYGLNIFFVQDSIALPYRQEALPKWEMNITVPEGVRVLSFAEAAKDEAAQLLLVEHLAKFNDGKDKISAWLRGNAEEAFMIVIPKGMNCQEPIVIRSGDVAGRLLIVAGAHSQATIIEQSQTKVMRCVATEIVVGDGANIRHLSVRERGTGHDFDWRRAHLSAGATMSWGQCLLGGGFVYGRTENQLTAPGASVIERVATLGRDNDLFDLESRAVLSASRCNADLTAKTALAGRSKAVIRGLIRIEKGTAGCVGRQKEDTLVLSPTAEIDTVPNLEIETHDVVCSHAAATGRIDEDRLFYLMSRGLDRRASIMALVEGFFAPVAASFEGAAEATCQEAIRKGIEDMIV